MKSDAKVKISKRKNDNYQLPVYPLGYLDLHNGNQVGLLSKNSLMTFCCTWARLIRQPPTLLTTRLRRLQHGHVFSLN